MAALVDLFEGAPPVFVGLVFFLAILGAVISLLFLAVWTGVREGVTVTSSSICFDHTLKPC